MVRAAVIGLTLLATSAPAQQMSSAQLANMKSCDDTHGLLISEPTISVPIKGEESEVEIGQSIVSTMRGQIMQSGLSLNNELRFTGSYVGAGYEVVIPPGKLRPVYSNRGPGYTSDLATFKYDREKKPRSGFGKPSVWISAEGGRTIGYVSFGLSTKTSEIPDATVTSEQCLLLGSHGFRRELLYSGVSKGTVSIEYREFMNDIARPAFSQELKYDLTDGSEIGFKGARIQILKATNTSIRYRVLKPLD